MNGEMDRVIIAAADWHAASQNDDMDWAGFIVWLETDPRHRHAYDEIALADALLDKHRATLIAQTEGESAVAQSARFGGKLLKWTSLAGFAIAASLTAAILVPQFLTASSVYETQAASRRVTLVDGSTITLAPHSRLTVSGRGRAQIALTGGAWFDVRHDTGRLLAIAAGPLEIRDIGTSFDVQAQSDSVRVSVVEGQLTVASQVLAQPIRLERGRSLLFDGKEGSAVVKSTSVPDIGAWRSGRLFYEGTPLPLVLDDLSRYAGVRVTLPDSLRGRYFSGSLIIHDGEAAVRDLAEVLDLELVRSAGGFGLRERIR